MKDVTEREAVVAWLRSEVDCVLGRTCGGEGRDKNLQVIEHSVWLLESIIERIERGDHLPKEQNDG